MSSSKTLKLFAYIQMTDKEIIRSDEVRKLLQMTNKQEQNFSSRLCKKRTIIRLLPDTYLVPKTIPPSGKWQPDALYIISQLMKLINANYYITGLYVLNYYGLSKQIPNQFSVYNDILSTTKKFGSLNVKFIKVPKARIGSIKKIELANKKKANISSLSRTLVDAVYDWKRFVTMPAALGWIDLYLTDFSVLKNIVKDTLQYGNISTKRRIGYYLMKKTQDLMLVKPILKQLNLTKNWVPLDPTGPRKGPSDKTWRIIDNVS